MVGEMAAKGVQVKRRSKGRLPLPRAAGELLKMKLHELRQALYQPLLHLFDEVDLTADVGGSLRAPDSKSLWERQLRKARDSQCSVREGVAKALAVVSSAQADSEVVSVSAQ